MRSDPAARAASLADRRFKKLIENAPDGILQVNFLGKITLANRTAEILFGYGHGDLLGSLTPHPVNVRVIAATHHDLRSAVTAGQFREDLFYRLSMVELEVPALLERTEDIGLLANHFAKLFATQYAKAIRGLTPKALLVLGHHSWPGNVRELEHVIGRACMMTNSEWLDVSDLPEYLVGAPRNDGESSLENPFSPLVAQEMRLLDEALRASHGNQSEAARALGIGRDALRYKMKKFGLFQ